MKLEITEKMVRAAIKRLPALKQMAAHPGFEGVYDFDIAFYEAIVEQSKAEQPQGKMVKCTECNCNILESVACCDAGDFYCRGCCANCSGQYKLAPAEGGMTFEDEIRDLAWSESTPETILDRATAISIARRCDETVTNLVCARQKAVEIIKKLQQQLAGMTVDRDNWKETSQKWEADYIAACKQVTFLTDQELIEKFEKGYSTRLPVVVSTWIKRHGLKRLAEDPVWSLNNLLIDILGAIGSKAHQQHKPVVLLEDVYNAVNKGE